MRKLASIQKIEAIRPIEGADKIQVATMEGLGWECVVKKDEFKVGDLIVYFEVDSILPERAEFEFLREKKFRIKTIKLKKQVSQGLIFGTSILPNSSYNIGDDVTEILKVRKHDPQLVEESELISTKHQSKLLKFFMNYKLFRTIYLKLNQKHKGNWPEWISKTDEERIQSCPAVLMNNLNKDWYLTEKLDGQSGTFFLHKVKKWGFNSWEFGVCSRNVWLKSMSQGNYWSVAKKYDLERKLKNFCQEIVIQGEILNTNVQGNKYHVSEPTFYVFNVVVQGKRVSYQAMKEICNSMNLQTVPYLKTCRPSESFAKSSREELIPLLVNDSEGLSQLYKTEREGVVWRLVENPHVSFKVISPKFLLQEK